MSLSTLWCNFPSYTVEFVLPSLMVKYLLEGTHEECLKICTSLYWKGACLHEQGAQVVTCPVGGKIFATNVNQERQHVGLPVTRGLLDPPSHHRRPVSLHAAVQSDQIAPYSRAVSGKGILSLSLSLPPSLPPYASQA